MDNNILFDVTIKDDLYGFFMDGNFNGFKYDVGNASSGTVLLKSQSDTGGILIDLDSLILVDSSGVAIVEADLQDRARELNKIVSATITSAYIISVVETAFGITPI